jgi:histidine ammonia-lyase
MADDHVTLDGKSLTIEDLVRVARDPRIRVERHPGADALVSRCEKQIAEIVAKYRPQYEAHAADPKQPLPAREYGVTTGFGEFKDQAIHPDELEELQRNLLLSHTVGVGENTSVEDLANYFPAEVVRGALVTRLNAFLKGHSGVRLRLVEIIQAMLNRGVVPLVPLRGSVGASGDLCPLSHLFVTLLGHGRYYVVTASDQLRQIPHEIIAAKELGKFLGFDPKEMAPTFKEGLALTNGANFSSAMLSLGVHDAELLADAADTAAAFTLEVLCGCARALDPKVHLARGHAGQSESAARMRALIEGSTLVESSGAVQDAYSLRCAPQVHGASRDAIRYVRGVATAEINAATDNPLFFVEDDDGPFDLRFDANWPKRKDDGSPGYDGRARAAYSAGNFHGQPVALAADFLGIALAELANIAERRTQMLLDSHHNRKLPGNLTTRKGVNSGLMIAQYTAASLVSENKVLAHPASVDSIPTSANSEDHVSMSTHAARKMRTILGNSQAVIAIELLCAAQAADWRIGQGMSPDRDPGVQSVAEARVESERFKIVADQWSRIILPKLAPKLRPVYRAIRKRVPAMTHDQPLDGAVNAVRKLVETGSLHEA